MRKSTNYELNLVEGTDIVNPLVQDVPNYERIDEEMFKNANTSVPLATELLTGTVHALTRENPNASMFRFVATANYKSGDTFTVDGVQVTALLTSGEPLATGCYVINSNVLCCLVGTVLTMFCANSLAEINAVDSERLGGNLPEYYASAESVVEAINLSQNANQISLSNRESIGEMNTAVSNMNVYVGGDGKLHFVDFGGADTVLPFNKDSLTIKKTGNVTCTVGNTVDTGLNEIKVLIWHKDGTPWLVKINNEDISKTNFKASITGGTFKCTNTNIAGYQMTWVAYGN